MSRVHTLPTPATSALVLAGSSVGILGWHFYFKEYISGVLPANKTQSGCAKDDVIWHFSGNA